MRRIDLLTQKALSRPVAQDELLVATATFRETGELPMAIALARAVTRRCRLGVPDHVHLADRASRIRHLVNRGLPDRDDVLHRLYDEAVWGEEHVRLAARAVLRALKRSGFDVTRRVFEGVGIEDVREVAGGVGVWWLTGVIEFDLAGHKCPSVG